ncbi:MAG TPA: acyl-CoA dehydrogenase family protein [Candidatus Dormibacteraeota bacterium]|nr:acyl-CoA dehydrogenase family protein [Candidatus Dormibacteraeota bacterium]
MSDAVVEAGPPAAVFRERARAWLLANAPRRSEDAGGGQGQRSDLPSARAFQARLHDAGFAGISWPAAYGGQGLTPADERAFDEEASDFDLPGGFFTIGMGMCGPTLLDLGSEHLKRRYIRPLLRGEEIWCQLFSEPGAGSDVASLQMRAARDGDGWVLTGQKVWTSVAVYADYGAVIARTDPDRPKHQGISMFVVDMHAPGVTVRPLRDMTGGATFNEVFFDGVRVPAENLVGAENEGWAAAVRMLMHERVSIGGRTRARRSATTFESLVDEARRRGLAGEPLVRQRLADLYVRERVLHLLGARLAQEARAGRSPGSRGSVAKLAGAELGRFSADLAAELLGADAVAWNAADPEARRWAGAVLAAPAGGIAGGTNEIQRDIIGERVLGLPKEPQVDRDVPFRQLRVGTRPEAGR